MARAPAGLPAGIRVSDHISLGVIAKAFPIGEVRRVLAETGRASERERDLPAHVMVYYAVALALYTTASTREVLRQGDRVNGGSRGLADKALQVAGVPAGALAAVLEADGRLRLAQQVHCHVPHHRHVRGPV